MVENLNNQKKFEIINDAVAATHVVTDDWLHVTENIQGWKCEDFTPSFSLGYFEDEMILGKVTIFYKKVSRKFIKALGKILFDSRNRLRPTRVVLVNSEISGSKIKIIYESKSITLKMMENEASHLFFTCDTTCIEKNYDNLTYYEKKKNIKLVNSSNSIKNIVLSGQQEEDRFYNAFSLFGKNIPNKYKNYGIRDVIEELARRKDLTLLMKVEAVYKERKKWWNCLCRITN